MGGSKNIDTYLRAVGSFTLGVIVATIATMQYVDGKIHTGAAAAVEPVRKELHYHLDEMAKMRPLMDRSVRTLESKIDLLIEDCYRRGGCKHHE